MSYGADFILTLFTNDPEYAEAADRAGVDRIGLDLEALGKTERQGGSSSWISHHRIDDLPPIRTALRRATLFARTNPLHAHSAAEVEALLEAGVRVLMLPMFRRPQELADFVGLVKGRAEVVPLLETAAAAARIRQLVRIPGIHEIHVGLNDLYMDLGLTSHFELLVSPMMEMLSDVIREAGLRFAFGGIGRAGDTALPVPSELVYAQYPRLGANGALLSRVFLTGRPSDLVDEVPRARQRLEDWSGNPPEVLGGMLERLAHHVL